MALLEQSRINKVSAASPAPAARNPIDLSRLQNRAFIEAIMTRQWARVPRRDFDDLTYFAQTAGDLGRACPRLKFGSDEDLMGYLADTSQALSKQAMSGKGTAKDTMLALATLGELFQSGTHCFREGWRLDCRDNGPADTSKFFEPSLPAQADVKTLLARYSCGGQATKLYAANLGDFARAARSMPLASSLPSQDGPRGKLLGKILANCNRMAGPEVAAPWCQCYVSKLEAAKVPETLLELLASNPFVDEDVYSSSIVQLHNGARSMFSCNVWPHRYWRRANGKTTTACLTGSAPLPAGEGTLCTYHAAEIDFTVPRTSCTDTLTSATWGTREVSCARR